MDLKWSCNFRVANNIPIGAGKPTSELRKKIKIREPKLKSKLKRIINKIIAGEKYIKGIGPWLLGGYIVKPLLKNSIKSQYKEFFVNMDLCTKCMFCVTSCPTGAIEFENGKPKGEADTTGEKEVKFSFHGECTACMRCYNFCPAFAITFGKRSSDPDQNPRYLGPTLAIEKKIKTGQI